MTTGLLTGVLLLASLAYSPIGLPFLATYLLASAKSLRISGDDLPVAVLLVAKAIWVVSLCFLLDHAPVIALPSILGADLVLLVAFALRKQHGFFVGLSKPLTWLFLVDFAFNAKAVVTGADFLGRMGSSRPDDLIPRLGGVFGHPFYSINISVISILLAWCFKRRLILALSVANILMNGSLRGSLTVAVLVAVFLLLKSRQRFGWLFAASACLAASVFLVTYLSVKADDVSSGNYFRVFAWLNALDVAKAHPVLGFHGFSSGELPWISEDTIVEYGVAESTYLGYATHFGLFPPIAQLLVISYVFWKRVQLLRDTTPQAARFNLMAAAFAGVAFVDTFYGTLLGSILTTTCYGLICLSGRDASEPQRPWWAEEVRDSAVTSGVTTTG